MALRLLIVDDDPAFRRLCGMALAQEGIEHVGVGSSSEALKALGDPRSRRFDLILLDMELPGMKGWELLQALRDQGWQTPVVLVSVREGVEDKVRALDLGADDYVVKPCAFDELLSRLHAVLRRIERRSALRVGDLEIDLMLRRVRRAERQIDLTPREFELLNVLVEARGGVVSREDFLNRVWNLGSDPTTNFLQVHVSRLRRKLRGSASLRIETVAGHGYRLVEAGRVGGATSEDGRA
jgi:two-component system OmpR family response regulator